MGLQELEPLREARRRQLRVETTHTGRSTGRARARCCWTSRARSRATGRPRSSTASTAAAGSATPRAAARRSWLGALRTGGRQPTTSGVAGEVVDHDPLAAHPSSCPAPGVAVAFAALDVSHPSTDGTTTAVRPARVPATSYSVLSYVPEPTARQMRAALPPTAPGPALHDAGSCREPSFDGARRRTVASVSMPAWGSGRPPADGDRAPDRGRPLRPRPPLASASPLVAHVYDAVRSVGAHLQQRLPYNENPGTYLPLAAFLVRRPRRLLPALLRGDGPAAAPLGHPGRGWQPASRPAPASDPAAYEVTRLRRPLLGRGLLQRHRLGRLRPDPELAPPVASQPAGTASAGRTGPNRGGPPAPNRTAGGSRPPPATDPAEGTAGVSRAARFPARLRAPGSAAPARSPRVCPPPAGPAAGRASEAPAGRGRLGAVAAWLPLPPRRLPCWRSSSASAATRRRPPAISPGSAPGATASPRPRTRSTPRLPQRPRGAGGIPAASAATGRSRRAGPRPRPRRSEFACRGGGACRAGRRTRA